tara:strand:- start:3123 stop:3773 length:651 start_codon:yes stop_codon:yes gene_type:complete
MYISNEQLEPFFNQTIEQDIYGLRAWKDARFDLIIDINAGVGLFAFFAKMLHSTAKIYSFEPHAELFKSLKDNTSFGNNLFIDNGTLGNGKELKSSIEGVEELVTTYRFSDIIKKYNIDAISTAYVKIDCGGKERFLIGDQESEALLKEAKAVAIKVYFPGTRSNSNLNEGAESQPTWPVYDQWITQLFGDTHFIVYGSSRRRYGYGVYRMIKKKM